jgi:hypothetical protein
LKVMMSASSFLPEMLWSHVGKDAAARSSERRNGFKQHAHLNKGKKVEREAVCGRDRKALEQATAEQAPVQGCLGAWNSAEADER